MRYIKGITREPEDYSRKRILSYSVDMVSRYLLLKNYEMYKKIIQEQFPLDNNSGIPDILMQYHSHHNADLPFDLKIIEDIYNGLCWGVLCDTPDFLYYAKLDKRLMVMLAIDDQRITLRYNKKSVIHGHLYIIIIDKLVDRVKEGVLIWRSNEELPLPQGHSQEVKKPTRCFNRGRRIL